MKISKILLSGICVISAVSAGAQVRWGAEAGVNISHGYDTNKTKAGFNVGLNAEYSFAPRWFAEAALRLSSQPCGDEYQGYFENPGASVDKAEFSVGYTPYYLTLPLRVGYRMPVSGSCNITLAAGPIIGCGLFGNGNFSVAYNGAEIKSNINNIFDSDKPGCFSSSRFEYGANIRLGAEIKSHYLVGAEYSILHIAGDRAAVDNMGIFSLNLGYRF